MAAKDKGMRIRVERELREEFLEVCQREGRPAAQVLREFMRNYVAQRQSNLQPSLFFDNNNINTG